MAMLRKARTTVGSNWVPALSASSRPGRDGRHRLLVRAGRGHHVVGVGDGDDPSGQGDLVAGQAQRVSLAVVALVVLGRRLGPLTEPRPQRLDQLVCHRGVIPQNHPFLLRRFPRLVEDLRWHRQLADVVHQAGPVEQLEVTAVQAHLLADHRGVGPNPFGMAPREPVVGVERGGQADELLRRLLGGGGAERARFDLTLELTDGPGPYRGLEARRRPVGKDERQLEERGHGQEATKGSIGQPQHDGGDRGQSDPPDRDPGERMWTLNHSADADHRADRGRDRCGVDGDSYHRGQEGPTFPLRCARTHRDWFCFGATTTDLKPAAGI